MPGEIVTARSQPSASDAPLIPGWYGKMPCLGDFAMRRLPAPFVNAWDAWLQRSIAASRHELGDSWLDSFLTSPMWRFALTRGVCGDEARIGVLVPSVDKVGRYFPLTFALGLDSDGSAVQALAAEAWFADLEKVALSALNVDFSIDALERLLFERPFPEVPGRSAAKIGSFLTGLRNTVEPQTFHFSGGEELPAAIEAAARELLAESASARSFWWCVAPESGASELHVCAGLPPPAYFSVFLRGHTGVSAVTSADATTVASPAPAQSADPLSPEALALDPSRGDPLADATPLDPLKAFDSSERR